MAVDPSHRMRSLQLIQEMLLYFARAMPNKTFSGDFREGTSFKLLKGLEKRGMVTLGDAVPSHKLGDEQCYRMTFRLTQKAKDLAQLAENPSLELPTGQDLAAVREIQLYKAMNGRAA